MRTASDIADWWDEQHRQSKKELDRFVDENPNLFGVIVGTAVATAMDLGAGMVDMAKFGQGAASGTVGGFAKDGVRLIGIMGPLGKAAKYAQVGVNARLARLIVDTGGPRCGYISMTQAFRQTGTRAFAAVEDLAKALGKNLSELGGSRLAGRIQEFKSLGAKISAVKNVSTLGEIEEMTKNDGSVTMFSIVGKRMIKGVPKDVGHAVYAFRTLFGRLRIMNRGGMFADGTTGKTGEVFESLADLSKKYKILGEWQVREAAVMENVFGKVMNAASRAGAVAIGALAAEAHVTTSVAPDHNETVAQAFEIHKTIVRSGKKALEQEPPRYHGVVHGESLSKIAKYYYGNMNKWPLIYVANRDQIGGNPDLIKPRQRLLIPDLPDLGTGPDRLFNPLTR
jgi:LysM repeat protein